MSTTTKRVDSGWHRCDNCCEIWHGSALKDIQDEWERVDAGGTVPSGECPGADCGALCYPHKPNPVKTRKKNGLGKGFCDEHGEFKMDSEQTECPSCDDL